MSKSVSFIRRRHSEDTRNFEGSKMNLAQAVIQILNTGRNRCGLGFGKYPLGIQDAVEVILPLLTSTEYDQVEPYLVAFRKRLEQ